MGGRADLEALQRRLFFLPAPQEHQPDSFVGGCANQLAMMLEPALMARHRAPAALLAEAMEKLYRWRGEGGCRCLG